MSELQGLIQYLQDKEYIAWDTETTGVDKGSKIIGVSVCAEENIAFYVVIWEWLPKEKVLSSVLTEDEIPPLFTSLLSKNLIAHNAVFDCSMVLYNFGIDLMPYIHTDTMVLAHLLDENRHIGLKELGSQLFGESAKKEQELMKSSVKANGGSLTKANYEMYKADTDLMAKYGAKDALLTLRLFYVLIEELYNQSLEDFFFKDECMPLLRGPTYDLNTTGIQVDSKKLQELKGTLEAECLTLKSDIYSEILPLIRNKEPFVKKPESFNIGSNQQLAWLLFEVLGNMIGNVTDAGRDLCKSFSIRPPYSNADKRTFIRTCVDNKGQTYTNGKGKLIKIGDYWKYACVDKEVLDVFAQKYRWVEYLLIYNKNKKLLSTYVEGIQERMRYGVIHPSFLQTGTTSGRYSSRNPNFQNLPRDDKRIKSCLIARPGKVFIGADYSQLEPRVFASVSQDDRLMACFAKGEDFYSVVGMPIFNRADCTTYKKDKDSFAEKYPKLRNMAKAFALATPYGTSSFQQSRVLKLPKDECQTIINKYFEVYPKVELMMLESHQMAKSDGFVTSLYGRKRRIPEAKKIDKIYGKDIDHGELPYEARTLLNLGMNHRVQSSAASIVNRASIALHRCLKEAKIEAKIVLQVHDELIIECNQADADLVAQILKHSMEKTTILLGVELQATPVIANNLADLK